MSGPLTRVPAYRYLPGPWQDALDEVVNNGVSVIVAAGNDAADVDTASPANSNNVIPVAATTHSGVRAGYPDTGWCGYECQAGHQVIANKNEYLGRKSDADSAGALSDWPL